jgi:GNAT superfamily N-acetyltransferase
VEWEGARIGVFRRTVFADHIFIHEIQIHPDVQTQGVGTRLLQEQMEEARKRGVPLRLQVLRMNRARGLYSRLGFRETGENEQFVFMEWRENDESVS